MTASNWAQFVRSAGTVFRAGVAARLNLPAAVAALRSTLFAPPVTLTAPYTLKASDSHKLFLLGAASTVTVPPGLPFYFRVELRNITAGNRAVLLGSGVTMTTFNTPDGATTSSNGDVSAGGIGYLVRSGVSTANAYTLHGNIATS